MSGIVPRYNVDAAVTYVVKPGQTVTGGLLVEATTTGVQAASAGSTKVLGVATKDAIGTPSDGTGTTSYGAFSFDTSGPQNLVAVAHGHFVVAYSAAATFGAKLKATAAGTVAPWVSGTDAADLIVGVCSEAAGVGAAGNFLARIF